MSAALSCAFVRTPAPTEFNPRNSRRRASCRHDGGARKRQSESSNYCFAQQGASRSKSSIEIVSGETSPQKRLRVRNIEMDQLRQLIAATIVDG